MAHQWGAQSSAEEEKEPNKGERERARDALTHGMPSARGCRGDDAI